MLEPAETASPDGTDPENKQDAHARGLKPQVFADLAGDRDRR
ncbi:hypothetical protein [Corynebacterium sp. HS2168-gen11]|nr:hypothetical protein [Corynebacterium sp. HS2168-gen11]MCS4536408.1 hypothetical protein [Corynebacterium sp. HS2168-gen11]